MRRATSAFFVGHFLRFVVAVGHLTSSAVDAGHHPGRDGLHHLPQHLLVGVHLLPGLHNGGSELWLGLRINPLGLVFKDSPDLE